MSSPLQEILSTPECVYYFLWDRINFTFPPKDIEAARKLALQESQALIVKQEVSNNIARAATSFKTMMEALAQTSDNQVGKIGISKNSIGIYFFLRVGI